jgi:hypothetical protein
VDELLTSELRLAQAIRLTAAPPPAVVAAAAALPETLGDHGRIETLTTSIGFRRQFAADPRAALVAAGLPATDPVLAAIRVCLG